ncbi:MAG: DEAD/DEAH box helicase, partial [Mariprofundaceae bacterium]|nr:DEAD/DEAH box helicase [Mariprofundaceae bacterium]
MKATSFSDLTLKDVLRDNLDTLGYTKMTDIQAQSLPWMLQGQDVIAQAETGSGKTAAFALSLLQKLDVDNLQPQALVLCPTRELADQVAKEIRRLARSLENIKVLTLCGGMPIKAQISSLVFGAHIVVGTPGRIQDHIQRASIKLDGVQTLVLDEADRMLDMGFVDAIQQISQHLPASRQSLLFSATYSAKVKNMAKKMLKTPKVIKVASIHDNQSIEQHFFEVKRPTEKLDALRRVLLDSQSESTVVFCNTKHEAQVVTDSLIADGFSALDLTGDLEH